MHNRKREEYTFLMFLFDKKYGNRNRAGLPLFFTLIGAIVLIFMTIKNIFLIIFFLLLTLSILYFFYLLAKRENRKWKDRRQEKNRAGAW